MWLSLLKATDASMGGAVHRKSGSAIFIVPGTLGHPALRLGSDVRTGR